MTLHSLSREFCEHERESDEPWEDDRCRECGHLPCADCKGCRCTGCDRDGDGDVDLEDHARLQLSKTEWR
jgi:hypothetical protein